MIELNSIYKSYGDKCIFKNFSYTFPDKGVVCIKGASGCGKTTLLRIISGLEKVDSGDVKILGSLAYQFQEDRLLPWLTAIENVTCVIDKKDCDRAAKAQELFARLGLFGNEGEKIENLSGGMKRRVSFARALCTEPQILLLDEPFNGLDDETRAILIRLISEFSQHKLVVLVTHDNNDILNLATQVISL